MDSIYWIYDIPTWLFAVLTVLAFVAVNGAGFLVTRGWVRKQVTDDPHDHNEFVSYFFAGISAFYGITLGLVAVGAWQTFGEVEKAAAMEAAALGALYQDVSNYPDPMRAQLRNELKNYTRSVIDEAWPQQRRGLIPQNDTMLFTELQQLLLEFEPRTEGQKLLYGETLRQFNHMSELRQMRLRSVSSGIPSSLWAVILLGGLANLGITWLMVLRSDALQLTFTSLFAALAGLLIFLVAAMDNPYRGNVSIGPEDFELVYNQLMR
jgi:hypothetical protein